MSLYIVNCTIYNVLVHYTIHCKLYIIHCAFTYVCGYLQCTMDNAKCPLSIAQCTLYNTNWTLYISTLFVRWVMSLVQGHVPHVPNVVIHCQEQFSFKKNYFQPKRFPNFMKSEFSQFSPNKKIKYVLKPWEHVFSGYIIY